MLPIAIYLLWKHTRLRLPSAALFVAHGVAVLATGWADDWIAALLAVGADQVDTLLNLSPSRFIGIWWLPIGAVIGAWLILRGHPGFAAMAVNPYLLPHYLLFGLLELDPAVEGDRSGAIATAGLPRARGIRPR